MREIAVLAGTDVRQNVAAAVVERAKGARHIAILGGAPSDPDPAMTAAAVVGELTARAAEDGGPVPAISVMVPSSDDQHPGLTAQDLHTLQTLTERPNVGLAAVRFRPGYAHHGWRLPMAGTAADVARAQEECREIGIAPPHVETIDVGDPRELREATARAASQLGEPLAVLPASWRAAGGLASAHELELGMSLRIPLNSVSGLIDLARRAEDNGYSRVGLWDSRHFLGFGPAIAALALTTDRIGLGTYVTNPVTRSPRKAAQWMRTAEELAPGRDNFLAIGTGDSALRNIGLAPAKQAELERYLHELRDHQREQGLDWPVDVSVYGQRGIQTAVRTGSGILVPSGINRETVDWIDDVYTEAMRANGVETAGDVWFTPRHRRFGTQLDMASVITNQAKHLVYGKFPGVPEELRSNIADFARAYDEAMHGRSTPDLQERYLELAREHGVEDYLFGRFVMPSDDPGTRETLTDMHDWRIGGKPIRGVVLEGPDPLERGIRRTDDLPAIVKMRDRAEEIAREANVHRVDVSSIGKDVPDARRRDGLEGPDDPGDGPTGLQPAERGPRGPLPSDLGGEAISPPVEEVVPTPGPEADPSRVEDAGIDVDSGTPDTPDDDWSVDSDLDDVSELDFDDDFSM